MPNYQDSKIYKIVNVNNLNDDYVYVGSTTQLLSQRIAEHRSDSLKKPSRKLYQHIIGNGGWDNFKIILIEDFPCESKEQLVARENLWQKQMNSIRSGLNMINSVFDVEAHKVNRAQSMKRYYENNKDKLKELKKQYYEINKNKINEQKKEHYELNRDTIKQQVKRYRENNKDTTRQRNRKYRENNKNRHTCLMCNYQTSDPSKLENHKGTRKHQTNQAIHDFIHS